MAVVEETGARASGGADGWSSMFMDSVVKCGRDSERRLYLYGISSNRCPKCQARLRSDSNTCSSCHYSHKTPRKCTRCTQKNDPVMWCAECDAYFCASCHKKPHVLMLGSSKPHHCFAIDNASGKYFVESSWSDDFAAMVQASYRLRLHGKRIADVEAAKAPAPTSTKEKKQQEQQEQAKSVANGGTDKPAPPSSLPTQPPRSGECMSSTARHGITPDPVNASGDVLSGLAVVAQSTTEAGQSSSSTSPSTQEQSRKRQLPGSEVAHNRTQKSMRTNESSQSGGRAPVPAPTDGMSLYDRVKAMHDKRARAAQPKAPPARSPKMDMNQLLSQQNDERQRLQHELEEQGKREADQILQQQRLDRRQEEGRGERLKKERQRLDREKAEHLRNEQGKLELERAERLRMVLQQQERQRQEEERLLEELGRQKQLQEQQRQQRLLEEQQRHGQILRDQEKSRARQADAHSLMQEGSRFVSQAQHVLHTQPGYAVASMAPSNISAPMPQNSSARFTRVPSPVNVSHHAPRFQPASPSPTTQGYPFQSTSEAPVANGFSSMANVHGAPVYQGQTGVPLSRFEPISQDHDGNHHLVVRDPKVQRQQQQQQTQGSDAMITRRMSPGMGEVFSPSKSGEDDELRAIWVSDYDSVNALVMQLDSEITKRTEEGHLYVHRSNAITIPEQLKLQINNLRVQRDAATKKRFESAVRVLIFSQAVRSFAQQNEHNNIWSDVPDVLKSSHKKCAELAADIREFERQAQKLREGIDEAVSSGNPAQMQNVAHLGALIAEVEQKIRVSNLERDKQFIFMFQFSGTLRNMVRAEWMAPGRNYQLQPSQ